MAQPATLEDVAVFRDWTGATGVTAVCTDIAGGRGGPPSPPPPRGKGDPPPRLDVVLNDASVIVKVRPSVWE
jgi:hypothetical protein